jgi:hypothetical protein
MMFTYAIAALLVGFLIVFSCRVSLMLNTKRTFKRHDRALKSSRGAVISSPRLQDAIFALNERYQSSWAAEVEVETEFDW